LLLRVNKLVNRVVLLLGNDACFKCVIDCFIVRMPACMPANTVTFVLASVELMLILENARHALTERFVKDAHAKSL
jgi:hypothetical protein